MSALTCAGFAIAHPAHVAAQNPWGGNADAQEIRARQVVSAGGIPRSWPIDDASTLHPRYRLQRGISAARIGHVPGTHRSIDSHLDHTRSALDLGFSVREARQHRTRCRTGSTATPRVAHTTPPPDRRGHILGAVGHGSHRRSHRRCRAHGPRTAHRDLGRYPRVASSSLRADQDGSGRFAGLRTRGDRD